MKKFTLVLFLTTSLLMTGSLHAVTYPFPEKEPAYLKDETLLKAGTILYLFCSDSDWARKTIHTDDVLTVYREYPPDFSIKTREVGKIRILSSLGDYYFNGEVIEGEIQPGDLAKKESVACFITSYKKNSHHQ